MEQSAKQDWKVYVGAALLVAVLLGIYFVYPIQVIVVVSLMTLLFAIILSAPVDYLARWGLGRAWGPRKMVASSPPLLQDVFDLSG